jgi:hypothetical protein
MASARRISCRELIRYEGGEEERRMRRVFFLAALVALGGVAAAREPAPKDAGTPACKSRTDLRPAERRGPVRARPLIEEPRAEPIYAVIRKRGGCIEPVYVRDERRIGGR